MACRELALLPCQGHSWESPGLNASQKGSFAGIYPRSFVRVNAEIYRSQGDFHVQQICGKGGSLEQDKISFMEAIKTCTVQNDLSTGVAIHACAADIGLLEQSIPLGNAILNMYAKCGALGKCLEVFDELATRNVVTWNTLISAFARHGLVNEALGCLARMQDEGVFPNAVTFVCLLEACEDLGAVEKVHIEVGRNGALKGNVAIGTALVDAYAKVGDLSKAQGVFDGLPVRNIATWTALIAGYAQHGLGEKGLFYFKAMQDEGFSPNAVTCICTLKACGIMGAIEIGEEIHAAVSKLGWLTNNVMLSTALVDMYAKCGALAKAQQFFDQLQSRDIVTWNALIAGYAQHGLGKEALDCYRKMVVEGTSPNSVTFICTLKACSSIGADIQGEEIHAELEKMGLLGNNIILGTALVDMYANCGALNKAQAVFDKLPTHTIVTWNTLIGGYADHGHHDEVLNCYERMMHEGSSPNAVTFVSVMNACSNIGAAVKGNEIHVEASKLGLLENDSTLGNALVDMHAKCGFLAKAQGVFDMLPTRDAAAWNSLIAGYGQAGIIKTAFDVFMQMVQSSVKPDVTTFVSLLTICSHAGLVEDGSMIFTTMCNVFGILPTLEHFTCMVDVFSRSGQFGKAVSIIEIVPFSECLLMWTALISACQKWVHIDIRRWIVEHAIQLDEDLDATYISTSNIYVCFGAQGNI